MKNAHLSFLFVLGALSSLPACEHTTTTQQISTAPVKLSFMLTNDIHGHLQPNLTTISSIAQQVRQQPEYAKNQSAFFLLDSGDQFQGTLISNYDEGSTVFAALNAMKYDAIIPGNHDYDFGPIGWLWDQVTPDHNDGGPRGVIEKLAAVANFPMLSANTYYKASIKTQGSNLSAKLDATCVPVDSTLLDPLDFFNATRPNFLQPYTIIEKAGVRVALIGIDFHNTTTTTTASNVSDLCFRDEVSAYLDARRELEGKADVFVLLMHNGDVPYSGATDASNITRLINQAYPRGVDLVAAGHTHQTHNVDVGGVRVIQDGSGATTYGRVDLYFDPVAKTILTHKTQSWAGIAADAAQCDSSKSADLATFCSQLTFPIPSDPSIDALVAQATSNVAGLAKEKLATATETVSIARTGESALGDILADALRQATSTQVAFMNTGGIRTSIKKGDFLYENLFEVSPFQNLAVVMSQFPWKQLKAVLSRAINTCGSYGTLVESGLKIKYSAAPENCDKKSQLYTESHLVHVEVPASQDGSTPAQVLYDLATGTEAADDTMFSVATLDFLAAGGDSYPFAGPSAVKLQIARDMIRDGFRKTIPTLSNTIDGRFQNVATP